MAMLPDALDPGNQHLILTHPSRNYDGNESISFTYLEVCISMYGYVPKKRHKKYFNTPAPMVLTTSRDKRMSSLKCLLLPFSRHTPYKV